MEKVPRVCLYRNESLLLLHVCEYLKSNVQQLFQY